MKRLLVILLLLASPVMAQQPSQQPSYFPITGEQKIKLLPFGNLVDTFNDPSTLDTTFNWSSPTTSGTGATATYSQGQEALASGTGAGSYALLTSKKTFQITSPAFLLWRGAINSQVEIAGTCKEMGLFIAAGSPTCAAPVTDGILFEITTTGALQAVTYASGTRQLIADLSQPVPGITWPPIFNPTNGSVLCPARSTPQPTSPSDTCPHILDIWFNGNSAEFDIDFKPVAFMYSGALGPNNNLLRWSAMTINATSSVTTTLKINQAALADDSRSSISVGSVANVTPADCSIALTTGGSAQNIITAGTAVHGFQIMNIDSSAGSGEPVWISFTGTAAASTIGSYPLAAPTATTFATPGSYSSPVGFGPNTSISVVAATTGHKISCTKW